VDGASNESGIVNDGNFWRFRDQVINIIWRYATVFLPLVGL